MKDKAEQYVERNMNMRLSVGRILLKFPLDLAVEKIYFGQTERDTMLYADAIQVNVALSKLLYKEIEVRRLIVENAAIHFGDSLSGLDMNVAVKELNLRVDRLNLARQEAEIPYVSLRGWERANQRIQPGAGILPVGGLRSGRSRWIVLIIVCRACLWVNFMPEWVRRY